MAEQIMYGQKLPVRGAVAMVHIAINTLFASAGITDTIDITDLSVNVNFRLGRIDVARLTEDGQHLEQWVCGFSLDPEDLSAFGTPVELPGMSERSH